MGIEWKLSSDGMEWTVGADDLYLSVFDTGDRIMWDVGVSMRRRPTSEGKAESFDEGKTKAETFAREWVAKQAAALGDGWVSVEERLPDLYVSVLVFRASPFGWFCDIAQNCKHGQAVGWEDHCGDNLTVTHWRPLPPLPVAEVEG